jgi:hypothetical protein
MMSRTPLTESAVSLPQSDAILRWRSTVPLITNPFLLAEVFQAAFCGAAFTLVSICAGLFVMEGGLSPADVKDALVASGVTLTALVSGFAFVSLFAFRNRYFVLYQMDSSGIYHEGARGSDAGRMAACLRLRAFPVAGELTTRRVVGRKLLWEQIDSFRYIPDMHVILLKRGFWNVTRLYFPDSAYCEQAADYLANRRGLRQCRRSARGAPATMRNSGCDRKSVS